MRIEERIQVKHLDDSRARKRYYQDSIVFSTTTSPPSTYLISGSKNHNRCFISSPYSSPESMSFSSSDRHFSSEDDDSEIDTNPLLMEHEQLGNRYVRRQDIILEDHKRYRSQSLGESCWSVIHPINGWSASNHKGNFNSDTIDHGYHSMEPLINADLSNPQNPTQSDSMAWKNDNTRSFAINNDTYRSFVRDLDIDYDRTISPPLKELLSFPLNNNQTTHGYYDTLWHNSAWSAPQKPLSYNTYVNPFEEFLSAAASRKKMDKKSTIVESSGVSSKRANNRIDGQWWKMNKHDSVEYWNSDDGMELKYNEKDVTAQTKKSLLAVRNDQTKTYRTLTGESKTSYDCWNRRIQDAGLLRETKVEYAEGKGHSRKAEMTTMQSDGISTLAQEKFELQSAKLTSLLNQAGNGNHCKPSSPEPSRQASFGDKPIAFHPSETHPQSDELQPQSGKFLYNDGKLASTSSTSSTSSTCDVDVNMVARSFNNFTITSDKQREILRLLQEKRKTSDANICESQPRNEAKILNTTGKNFLRASAAIRRRRICRRPITALNGAYPEIADGLVLEKVRYDPNWRRQNSVLCSSDDNFKQFCHEVPVNNPLSVPNRRLEDDSGLLAGEQIKLVEQSINNNNAHPPSTANQESPTDNISPIEEPANGNCAVETVNACETPDENPTEEQTNHTICDSTEKNTSKPSISKLLDDFDVCDIESTMPTIDWAAMEANLIRAAEEDDWSARRRNDREEIRRRLALGPDADEYYFCGEKHAKKPSLTTRLQSGMNLQICFMNETASDSDGPNSDNEGRSVGSSADDSTAETKCLIPKSTSPNNNYPRTSDCDAFPPASPDDSSPPNGKSSNTKRQRPSFFFAKQRSWRLRSRHKHEDLDNVCKEKNAAKEVEDFYTRQARLQAEARLALSQAKEMARMQMEIERQNCKKSPISDIVGLSFPDSRHFSMSRQILISMNIAQLQVIVNDLHTQIEKLNEDLVNFLLKRDDLHMEQDSMLVDIEDLTRYLGAKEAGTHPLQNGSITLK